MAFVEFCCRSGGNNLNAGTVDGSSAEPSVTPLATYTGGDWNSATFVYTAPVGADMTAAVVGRYASLYTDGDTQPTSSGFMVGRITSVNAAARTITFQLSFINHYGTGQATSTGNKTMRIGGAWSGPSGSLAFPFSFMIAGNLMDAANNRPRVNFKNDQQYNITSPGLSVTSPAGPTRWQGYSSTYGDGGRVVFDGGTTGASYVLLNLSNAYRLQSVRLHLPE